MCLLPDPALVLFSEVSDGLVERQQLCDLTCLTALVATRSSRLFMYITVWQINVNV